MSVWQFLLLANYFKIGHAAIVNGEGKGIIGLGLDALHVLPLRYFFVAAKLLTLIAKIGEPNQGQKALEARDKTKGRKLNEATQVMFNLNA